MKLKLWWSQIKANHFINFDFLTCCLNTLGFSKMCRFIIDMSLQKDLMISGKMTFWYTCNCVFSCHKYVTWQFRSVTHRAASWHIISRKIRSWLLYSSCWYSLPRDKHFRLHRAYAIACLNCLLASPTVTNNYFQNNKQSCSILNILKLCKYVIHMYICAYIHIYIQWKSSHGQLFSMSRILSHPMNLSLQSWALAQWSFAIKHFSHLSSAEQQAPVNWH